MYVSRRKMFHNLIVLKAWNMLETAPESSNSYKTTWYLKLKLRTIWSEWLQHINWMGKEAVYITLHFPQNNIPLICSDWFKLWDFLFAFVILLSFAAWILVSKVLKQNVKSEPCSPSLSKKHRVDPLGPGWRWSTCRYIERWGGRRRSVHMTTSENDFLTVGRYAASHWAPTPSLN